MDKLAEYLVRIYDTDQLNELFELVFNEVNDRETIISSANNLDDKF